MRHWTSGPWKFYESDVLFYSKDLLFKLVQSSIAPVDDIFLFLGLGSRSWGQPQACQKASPREISVSRFGLLAANSGRCIKYPVYDRSLGCASLGVNERDHLVASTMKPVTPYCCQKVIFNIPLHCKFEERSVIPPKKYEFISSFSSATRASLWLALSNWENASKNWYTAKACWDFDQQENFWPL